MRRILAVAALVVGGLMGCTTQSVEEPVDGKGAGQPCTLDDECNGLMCIGGICSATGQSSSGVVTASSSSGGSGSGSGASGGAMDAGMPDAAVPAGRIALTPDGTMGAVEFGATRVGTAVTQNVLVTNVGEAAATIITLGFRNNASGEFTLTVVGGQPAALMPGEQMTLRITHTATDATSDNAFLTVVTNASNPLVELPLLAAFKGDPVLAVSATPEATDELTTLQLSPTPVGTPVTAHLFVKNVGQADSALGITSITLDPPVSALFSVSSGPLPRALSQWPGLCADLGGCTAGATACTDGLCVTDTHPMDVVDVALTFNAGQPGEAMIDVVITADVAGTPTTRRIPVVALAQDSRIEVTPSPIAFGNVFLNRSRTQQITLKNPDDAPSVLELTDVGIRFTPAPYSVQLGGVTFPYPLTPGSSVVVTVAFNPTNPGSFNNSLAISRSNAQPLYVPITGAGIDEPEADVPGSLDFGGVIPGSPRTLPLTIGNTGNGPLTVSNISVTPASAPFSVNVTSLPDIAPMTTNNSVQVTYAPVMQGTSDSATLLLETNDPDRPLIQVGLSGQGVVPVADVTPAAGVEFGAVLVGSPAVTRTITVRNNGQGSLSVESPLRVRNSMDVDIPQYQVTSSRPLPAGVASGDQMTFTLTFNPAAPQHYNGSIVITTNDPMRPTFTIPVNGSGHNCASLPNATVSVVNGTQCAYMCVANAVQCSDQSCVVCPARHAATPSCTAGNACTYTCPSNTGEAIDPSGTCSGAYNLGSVEGAMEPFPGFVIQSGNPIDNSGFRPYPAGDHDWFRFRMADRLDWLEGSPGAFLRATVRLSNVASGESLAFEVLEDTCSGGGTPVVVGPGQIGEHVGRRFCDRSNGTDANDNVIPRDDSRTFYVHVYPQGDSYQCSNYRLEVEVEEVGFFGSLGCL